MVTSENMMSFSGQHALQDMVEMEMYLVSQSQQTPWPLLPRRSQKPHAAMKPCSKSVELSAAEELVGHGFVEATSRRTFVVSNLGYQFYEREIKPHFSLNHKARELDVPPPPSASLRKRTPKTNVMPLTAALFRRLNNRETTPRRVANGLLTVRP